MTKRVVSPSGRGFLLLDSHPAGCIATVADLTAEAAGPQSSRAPVVVIIGSSAGYGLAATVAGIVRHRISGVCVALERPPGRRTATAGWYRTIATADLARQHGSDLTFINADAFTDTAKEEVLDLVKQRYGRLDCLIYSVAAPRRTDPRTGQTYQSVIKPLGSAYTTKTLEFDPDGPGHLREITVEPASDAEKAATVRVMGGEDWSRWVQAAVDRGLAGKGFATVALSYIGSSLTSAIYRSGTIGAAKKDLEATAAALDQTLSPLGGHALTSVNGAAVTQASTAIPGIALYVSLLRAVLGDAMVSPVRQSLSLWEQLLEPERLDLDEEGRIRLDRWELAGDVQAEVARRWQHATPETIGTLADLNWFRVQVRQLYGFDVPGVDYDEPVDPDLPWPTR